ncbi:MAG TPA: tetratricopeptide repeat protein [Polyangiaceae bacterium]|nr:tetratricopeptide repeat protein [Polyangiaceae bacterium]
MVRLIRRAFPLLMGLGLGLGVWSGQARDAVGQTAHATASPAAKAEAKARFTKAKALYKQGKYRAAVEELEAARALDPEGVDLVYNLAVVHEKMAEIDKAIEYYKLFVTMVEDPAEKERVSGIVQRLEGARTEIAPVPSTSATEPSPPPPPDESASPPPAPPPPPPGKGRFDGWVVTTGLLAGAGLATGVVLGVKANGEKIGGTPVTNEATSYENLQDRNDRAKKLALFADVGFGVAVVGAVTCALLYFTRDAAPSEEAPKPPTEAGKGARTHAARPLTWTPSVSLLPGGGAMAGIGGGF